MRMAELPLIRPCNKEKGLIVAVPPNLVFYSVHLSRSLIRLSTGVGSKGARGAPPQHQSWSNFSSEQLTIANSSAETAEV